MAPSITDAQSIVGAHANVTTVHGQSRHEPHHGRAAAGDHLLVLRFARRVQPPDLVALQSVGLEVITYVPRDSLVVVGRDEAAATRRDLVLQSHIVGVDDMQPASKISADLRAALTDQSSVHDIIVLCCRRETATRLRTPQAQFDDRSIERCGAFWRVAGRANGAAIGALAGRTDTAWIERAHRPIPADETQAQIVAGNLPPGAAAPPAAGYLAWLGARGFSQGQFAFVVDIADTGVDRGQLSTPLPPGGAPTQVNPEFRELGSTIGPSRLVYARTYVAPTGMTEDEAGHGTLCASILAGFNDSSCLTPTCIDRDASGFRYGLGIAPFVRIGSSRILGATNAPPFGGTLSTAYLRDAYNDQARISSNSWTTGALGVYDTVAMAFDAAVRDADPVASGNQEMCIVFAAGNSDAVLKSPATSKNVITVGASETPRNLGVNACPASAPDRDCGGVADSDADHAEDVWNLSSPGPCNDGRRKPDLMAPGSRVQGASSTNPNFSAPPTINSPDCNLHQKFWPPVAAAPSGPTTVCDTPCTPTQAVPSCRRSAGISPYSLSSGTSFATPAVAGAAALVRQDFINHGLPAPSPAMTKAVLMATAHRLTGTGAGPAFGSTQGAGRVDLGRAFDRTSSFAMDQTVRFIGSGAAYSIQAQVADPSRPVIVALVWTDAPGVPFAPALLNDLDLVVTAGNNVYRGGNVTGVCPGFGACSVPGGSPDHLNNSEFVVLPPGVAASIAVTVHAFDASADGVPSNADAQDQDFALYVYNAVAVDSGFFSLTVDQQPLGPGSIRSLIRHGHPGQPYFTAFTTHAGNFPGGFWFGIDPSIFEIVSEYLSGMPPFVGNLDAQGQAELVVPPPWVPTGLTIFAVTVGLGIDGGFLGVTAPTVLTTL